VTSGELQATEYYRPHYPRFSGDEYERRYRLVREQMVEHGVDCLVVTGSTGMNAELMADVHWLSNWNHIASQGFVVFPLEGDPTLFCSLFVYRDNALQRSVIEDVRPGVDVSSRIEELKLTTGAIGVVGSFPHEVMDEMRAKLPGARIVPCSDWFGEVRRPRSDEELEWIRKGAELSDLGMEAMVRAIRPGVTERQLHAATVNGVLEAGGDFCFQWVGSTPMSAPRMVYPSQYASNRPIERGDLIVTEIAAAYEGMAGQVNRCIAVGEEPPRAYLELHEAIVRVYHEMCAALQPGATPAEVSSLAKPLEDAGYRLDFLAIGRPSGPSTPPVLPRTPSGAFFNRPFVENETVMILPMPEKDGVGLFPGNLVLVRPGGAESLQRFPFDEFLVV
jgi:Xaa-Pro aminopeptidase